MKNEWDVEAAIATYNVDRWGGDYFTINEAGNVVARPLQENGGTIDLLEVVNEARNRGLGFPLVIRFQDLLRHRVEAVNRAFQNAITEFGYKNGYRGVFPIKVNQLREVIEEIVDAGAAISFRARRRAANRNWSPRSRCTRTRRVSSSATVQGSRVHSHRAARSQTRQVGHHRRGKTGGTRTDDSRGERSRRRAAHRHSRAALQQRFRQVVAERRRKREVRSGHHEPRRGERDAEGGRDSRIVSSSSISMSARRCRTSPPSSAPCAKRRAITRSSAKLGHELGYLDVGGGLGVDYDGSRSDFDSSTNYSLQEYANDVVWNIMDVCDSEGVPHPAIVSEGGRAIVAHHSVLVVEAFSSIEKTAPKLKVEAIEKDHKLVRDILEVKQRLKRGNRIESLHDIQQIKEESQQTFDLGLLDLESKAKIDTVYWQMAQQIVNMHRGLRFVPGRSQGTRDVARRSIHLQFFRFPVASRSLGARPIVSHHADSSPQRRPPDRNGMIVDITCDSDGKVSKFIDLQDVKETLPLHRIIPGELYYLGVFMVGAYQDIMGDLHNLFGRVTEVHIFLDPDEESGWYIEEVIEGSTIGEVLSMTQWDKVELMRLLKTQVDAAIKTDRLKPNDAMKLLSDYERLLQDTPSFVPQRLEARAPAGKLAAVELSVADSFILPLWTAAATSRGDARGRALSARPARRQ